MRDTTPVSQDRCILQRIFDGTVKTNKVNVNGGWQKHAIATLMEPSVLWTRDYCVGCGFVADCGYPKCITSTCNRQSKPLYVKKTHLVYKYKNQDLIWMPLPPKRVTHGFIYSVFLGY